MQYLSTPKEFQNFDRLKDLKYNRNMMTSDARSELYWEQAKVVVEMADAYHVFTRSIFFNQEMADTYRVNIDRYMSYFTSIVRNIDVYLQEDQLMHTQCSFPLVPIPTYLPTNHELEQSNVHHIEDAV